MWFKTYGGSGKSPDCRHHVCQSGVFGDDVRGTQKKGFLITTYITDDGPRPTKGGEGEVEGMDM